MTKMFDEDFELPIIRSECVKLKFFTWSNKPIL